MATKHPLTEQHPLTDTPPKCLTNQQPVLAKQSVHDHNGWAIKKGEGCMSLRDHFLAGASDQPVLFRGADGKFHSNLRGVSNKLAFAHVFMMPEQPETICEEYPNAVALEHAKRVWQSQFEDKMTMFELYMSHEYMRNPTDTSCKGQRRPDVVCDTVIRVLNLPDRPVPWTTDPHLMSPHDYERLAAAQRRWDAEYERRRLLLSITYDKDRWSVDMKKKEEQAAKHHKTQLEKDREVADAIAALEEHEEAEWQKFSSGLREYWRLHTYWYVYIYMIGHKCMHAVTTNALCTHVVVLHHIQRHCKY